MKCIQKCMSETKPLPNEASRHVNVTYFIAHPRDYRMERDIFWILTFFLFYLNLKLPEAPQILKD